MKLLYYAFWNITNFRDNKKNREIKDHQFDNFCELYFF